MRRSMFFAKFSISIFRQCVSHKKGNVSQCLLFLFQRIVSEQNIRIEKSNVLVHFVIAQSREFTVFRIFLLYLKVKAMMLLNQWLPHWRKPYYPQFYQTTILETHSMLMNLGCFIKPFRKKTLHLNRGKMFRWQKQQDSTNRSCSCKYDWRKASSVCHWKVAKTTLF